MLKEHDVGGQDSDTEDGDIEIGNFHCNSELANKGIPSCSYDLDFYQHKTCWSVNFDSDKTNRANYYPNNCDTEALLPVKNVLERNSPSDRCEVIVEDVTDASEDDTDDELESNEYSNSGSDDEDEDDTGDDHDDGADRADVSDTNKEDDISFNYLNCWYTNVEFISNKFSKFKVRVQENTPEIIAVVETGIQSDPNNKN